MKYIVLILFFISCTVTHSQTQSGSTINGTLDVNSCGSSGPPTWCSGADIGAWINSADSYLSSLGYNGGDLLVEASSSCYQFSTPILLHHAFSLRGQGADAACLQYMRTSGVAITYDTGDRTPAGYGLHSLQLAGTGGNATGVVINGTGAVLENVTIGGKISGLPHGFHVGVLFAGNAYLSRISHSLFQFNDQQVYFPGASTALNSGENIVFDHVTFANGSEFANCVQIGDLGSDGPQVTFISSSFDDCQLVNKDSMILMVGGHFELVSSQSQPYIVTIDDNFLGFSGPHSTTLLGTQIFDNPPNAIISGSGLLEVDRSGSLNIIGLSDRGTRLVPLVYLNSGQGGTPKFSIFAPDTDRTMSQLYSVAPGTVPAITNLTNGLIDSRHGYMANGNTVIPSNADGFHGGSGTKVQMSDGSGTSHDFPVFNADGTLSDSGYGPSAFPVKTGTEVAGHAACWKATGTIGYCSSAVKSDGSCVCK